MYAAKTLKAVAAALVDKFRRYFVCECLSMSMCTNGIV